MRNKVQPKRKRVKHTQVRVTHGCHFQALVQTNENLTEKQRKRIEETPFAFLLKMMNFEANCSLLSVLLDRWDSNENGFRLKNRLIKFTPYDVALILGLRCRGKRIDLKNQIRHSSTHNMFYACSQTVEVISSCLQNFKNDDAVEDFVRGYISLAFGSMLFPVSTKRIPSNILYTLDDLSELSDYEWGTAVYDFLIEGLNCAQKSKKEGKIRFHVAGCVMVLQIWALEHVGLYKSMESSLFPRILRWNGKKISPPTLKQLFDEIEIINVLEASEKERRYPVVREAIDAMSDYNLVQDDGHGPNAAKDDNAPNCSIAHLELKAEISQIHEAIKALSYQLTEFMSSCSKVRRDDGGEKVGTDTHETENTKESEDATLILDDLSTCGEDHICTESELQRMDILLSEINETPKEIVSDDCTLINLKKPGKHDLANLDSDVLGCAQEVSCPVTHAVEHEHRSCPLPGEVDIGKNIKKSLVRSNSTGMEMVMSEDLRWPRICKRKRNPRKQIAGIKRVKGLGLVNFAPVQSQEDNIGGEGNFQTSATKPTNGVAESDLSNPLAKGSLLDIMDGLDSVVLSDYAQDPTSLSNPETGGRRGFEKGIRLESENDQEPVYEACGSNNRNATSPPLSWPIENLRLPKHRSQYFGGWISDEDDDFLPPEPAPQAREQVALTRVAGRYVKLI